MTDLRDHYPAQLAESVQRLWPKTAPPLPSLGNLTELLSTCYQASLLREEGRATTFRLLLGAPGNLPRSGGPPAGFQVLRFEVPRSFAAGELRRLAPAAEFYRAMLGAGCGDDGVVLWGIVHTGPGWSREQLGGRSGDAGLPDWLVVHVRAPGELSAYCGHSPLATLRFGAVEEYGHDVFLSAWLASHFAEVRLELIARHEEARAKAEEPWADLDPDFIRVLAQHVVRRTLGVMRQRRHGGAILFLPLDAKAIVSEHLRVKYPFADSDARRRFREVLIKTLGTLAASHAGHSEPVGWAQFSASGSRTLAELDEAIFEIGHLLADLSSVDGAVVLTQGFEILGFGAEISGLLPAIQNVSRALDRDAVSCRTVPVDEFGTRHSSVFRLCASHQDIVAIVVSQDGQVRFVKCLDGVVTYFDHRVLGAL